MKISNKAYILILILIILILSLITYWRFAKFRMTLPKTEIPKVEIPKMEFDWQNTLFPENEEKEEWVSPDNKLKLSRSASWQKMDQTILKHAGESGIILTESEALLFAYRLKPQEQSFALLIVSRVDAGKSLEEIIKEMEQNIKEGGGEIEMTLLEEREGTARLKIVSKYTDQMNFHSEGKIIFGQEKTYLIFITSPQKDWPQFEEESEEIINSAYLL